jgi:hypothetical protein
VFSVGVGFWKGCLRGLRLRISKGERLSGRLHCMGIGTVLGIGGTLGMRATSYQFVGRGCSNGRLSYS